MSTPRRRERSGVRVWSMIANSVPYVNVNLAAVRLSARSGGYASAALDLREEQVVLETDRYRISGTLTLPREGYRSRLSDYVNQRDREFFTLSGATVTALDEPGDTRQASFLMVGRSHVRLISSASDSAGDAA